MPATLEAPEIQAAVPAPAKTQARYNILLGVPGPTVNWETVEAAYTASDGRHKIILDKSKKQACNFNKLWARAHNAFEAGKITHCATLHGDCFPEPGWLDALAETADAGNYGFVSVPSAIKDPKRLVSTGIGNPDFRWTAFRRFTLKELAKFPDVITAENVGYPGSVLMHNNGCCLIDLRFPQWRTVDQAGGMIAYFQFLERVFRTPAQGLWESTGQSEDWMFSYAVHKLGIPTAVLKTVKMWHRGTWDFANWGDVGDEHDEESRPIWGKGPPQKITKQELEEAMWEGIEAAKARGFETRVLGS